MHPWETEVKGTSSYSRRAVHESTSVEQAVVVPDRFQFHQKVRGNQLRAEQNSRTAGLVRITGNTVLHSISTVL